jgi:hypothetical protein
MRKPFMRVGCGAVCFLTHATAGQPASSYRPALLTVGVGVSLARSIGLVEPPNE